MSEFNKELRKVLTLIGVGLVLVVAFMMYGRLSLKDFFFDFESMIVGVAILLYPLGIAYGWRQIAGFYSGMRKGDRIGHIRGGYNTVMITAIWIGLAIALTFMFGWVFGTINAIKKLHQLKKCNTSTISTTNENNRHPRRGNRRRINNKNTFIIT